MKTKSLFLSALAVLTLAACQKDNDGMMRLTIEGMGDDSKMAVQDSLSYWATGDQVKINGTTLTVSINVNNTDQNATTSVEVSSAAPYYGVYPAGITSSYSAAGYTLDLPANYTYATTVRQGHTYQLLHAPMVGYSEGNTMQFKHVTAAINVQVKNYHYDYAIVVDAIEVSSATYKLCGETSVTFDESNNVNVVAEAASVDSTKKVTMLFNSTTPLQIAANGSAVVQVPVLPVGSDNKFTVKIIVHRADDATVNATLERTQTTGGNLDRARLGYAMYTFGGPFSVSDTKKVVFSAGNLQYQASTGNWKFADHQYDCIGDAAGNNVDTNTRKTQSAWIDVFCWGASGYDGKNPYTILPMKYTPPTNISGTNYDWGVYNTIGNSGSGWYTPTWNELNYVITNTSGRPTNRFMKAKIGSTYGLIIFPDNYINPVEAIALANVNEASTGWASTYDATSCWGSMELVGAVFFPAAGYGRTYGTTIGISSVNSIGHYWVATYSSNKATYFNITTSSVTNSSIAPNNYAKSVRLVRDVN